MFKGLKSKLEDEAKKLQASVQQYSEQLTQQVEHMRSGTSDAGSEGGSSISRRFLNTVSSPSSASYNLQDSLNHSVGNALMEEVTEGDLLGLDSSSRQRRLSGGSAHSTESSLSTLFQSVPGLAGTTLDTADSDNETLDEYSSGVIRSATKDQISTVLSRLQGRASTYKDKYRDLVKKYNEVVTENNKCRTVLAQTQDKALDRIEKLKKEKKMLGERLREIEESRGASSPADHKIHRYEEMLEKCKAEITRNRAKIKELSQANEKLSLSVQAAESESDISTLVADRVANEWKQRIDKVEEEWTNRMNKSEADHAIQLATTKADMHAALESKDKEIESWRSKCRALEIQDGQANERWQKKVDELQQVVQALEVEKSDMIEKLSAAKLQGVKAVRDEEEKKREELVAEFTEKMQKLTEEAEMKAKDLESASAEISQLKAEIENLRGATVSRTDEHEVALSDELERVRSELLELENSKQRETKELRDSLTSEAEKHRQELAELMREQDEIVSSVRKQQMIELEGANARFELAREEADTLRLKNETLEKQLEQLDESYTQERLQAERALQEQIEELRHKLKDQKAARREQNDSEISGLRDSYSRLCESNDDLKKKLEELTQISSEQMTEAKQLEERLRTELSELRSMLETRNSEFRLVEKRQQELEEEIAAARELSAMHDRLRVELEETRKQRDDIEHMVMSLKERAERAEKALEEDRVRLNDERTSLERSVEERKERESLISLSTSDSEFERRVTTDGYSTSVADLTAQTAGEMTASDELQQLRAEIAQLNDMNAELATKVSMLEVEKSSIEKTKDEAQKLLEELKLVGGALREKSDQSERLGACGDVGFDVSVEDAQSENVRLSEELRRNMHEIELARTHRAALEKELLELKALVAERQSSTAGAEVLISLQGESASQNTNDEKQNQLQHQIDALEEQLKSQKEEIERLIQLVEAERGRAEEASDAVKQKEAEQEAMRVALMSDVNEKDSQVTRLEEEVKRVQSEEKDARLKCEDAQEHCRQLEGRINELVFEMDKLHLTHNEERAQTASELEQLRGLQNDHEAQLEDLTEKLKISEENLRCIERDLETARSSQSDQARGLEAEVSELRERLKENCKSAAEESQRSEASLKELQDNLREEEQLVVELQEKLEIEKTQIASLQSEMKQKEDELQKQIALSSDQVSPAASKVRELEELNDKMRLEFLAKENVITELRAEIDRIQCQQMESVVAEQGKLREAQDKISKLGASEKEARNSLLELQAQLIVAEEKLKNVEKARAQEKYEEERIREQYANALENLKTELADAHNRINIAESAESECERLKNELEKVKKQCEDEAAKYKEETDSAIQDYKLKAEKKIAKIKAAAEKDVNSAKAEFLLEMDDLRRNLSERDRRVDELVVEKARTEQQLIGQQEMEKELEQRRLKEKELNDIRMSVERRIVELETANRLLEQKNAELVEFKEKSEARAEESEKDMKELQSQDCQKRNASVFKRMIQHLQSVNEEGFRKAVAKQDSDNKKAVRELQREVKQLYVELNEKTEALDVAQARISELESISSGVRGDAVMQKQTHQDAEASSNYGYEEELDSMRRKLKECHREVDGLREANTRLERLLEQNGPRNNSPAVINVNGGGLHDGLGFADPAEAEYLKNVLYRYMYSRENLGKEAVTLARVIGTVAKFSKSEMDNVITREESRVAGWVGGTVSHVLTGR